MGSGGCLDGSVVAIDDIIKEVGSFALLSVDVKNM
jgi:hypothetical protein